ncbi:MAG: tripartite tricarboxylate transporter substrate binding protein [Betaproteobacteria bacterium]|nr:tripartite tricarboxylate transporter substrate binding protein [Betaproteobacteria bacterium]
MRSKKPARKRAAVLAVVSLLAASYAAAAQYPDKPIRIIVPVTPGGGSDLLARLIAQQFSDRFEQPFIVDNRAGAGGTIGSELAARAAPDGYTLIVAYTASHGINPAIKKLPYDVINDFAPISMLGTAPNILVVHPSVAAKSVSELIQFLKSRPGQVNYASAGNGSAPHLAAEMFKYMAGVEMTHIPYKGAAPGVTDLLGGQVLIMFPSMPAALAHARSGRLRALAVTSKARASAAPELPTVAEAGLPGFEVIQWYALLAPAHTPKNIIDKLNAETNRMLKLPDIRVKLAAQGLESSSSTPAEVSAFMRGEVAKWTKFIRDTGLKLD